MPRTRITTGHPQVISEPPAQPLRNEPAKETPRSPKRVDGFEPLRIPATRADAGLNVDGSLTKVGPFAEPRASLSMDEIRAAPPERRADLANRLAGLLSFWAGSRLGAVSAALPTSGHVTRGPYFARAEQDGISFGLEGGTQLKVLAEGGRPARIVSSDGSNVSLRQARELGLEVFSHLLGGAETAEKLDGLAAQFHLGLLGPRGALDDSQSMPVRGLRSPKLLCWDFNGTIQDGRGRFRPGMAQAVETLARMGAASVLTTSIPPEGAEKAMRAEGILLSGIFGSAEVRPTRGDKQYEGVAREHGLTPARAPHQLVVIGDSDTDIPGDDAVGLFINDTRLRPASAVELIVDRLDEYGDGSIHQGLLRASGGKLGETPVPVAIEPLTLSVALRTSSSGHVVPVVEQVYVTASNEELARWLTAPSGSGFDASRLERLAFEHVSWSLEPDRLVRVLHEVKRQGGDSSRAVDAVRARLGIWAEDAARAQLLGGQLEKVLARPVGFNRVAETLHDVAAAGDPRAAASVAAAVQRFADINDAAERSLAEALDAFAERARTLASHPRSSSWPLPSNEERAQALRTLMEAASQPLPFTPREQGALLEALETTAVEVHPEIVELRKSLLQSIEHQLPNAHADLAALFAHRRAQAPSLSGLGDWAIGFARQRQDLIAEVTSALAAM